MRRPVRRPEDGQITVMTIGFLLVIGLLAVVVVNASGAYLQRQELRNLTDGAALTAADGLDRAGFYTEGEVEISGDEARELVADYVGGAPLSAVRVSVVDDRVSVRLERVVDLAIAPPGWEPSTTIVAEATSQLRVSE